MLKRGGLAAVTALLLLAGPALAVPPVSAPDAHPSAGPVLVGGQAAWTSGVTFPSVSGFALHAMDERGVPSTLIQEPGSFTDGRGEPGWPATDLAGSPTRLAAHWFTSYQPPSYGRSVYSTPNGFQPFGGTCRDLSLDLWQDTLAHTCNGEIFVTDLNSGKSTRIEGEGRDVHIAGKYLAWAGPVSRPYEPEVVVYDREAAKEVYRVNFKALLPPADFAYVNFDLREDGTLVAVYNSSGSPGPLAWFSPADPRPHVIVANAGGGPVVAGNLIAISRRAEWPHFELAVIDFAGNTVQAIERDPGDYDFDGQRITWYSKTQGVRLSRFPVDTGVDLQPPRTVSALTIRPARFRVAPQSSRVVRRRARVARRTGATVRFTVSRPARVSALVERRAPGVLRKGACRPVRRGTRGRKCVRYVRTGTIALGRRARGKVSFRFSGRLGRRSLKPGPYRLVVQTQIGSRATRELATPFRVVR